MTNRNKKGKGANKSNATATTNTKAINYVHAKSHQAITDFFSWYNSPREFFDALHDLHECAIESELSDDRETRTSNLNLISNLRQLGKSIL